MKEGKMIHSKVSIRKLLAIPVLVLGMAFLITGHVKAQDVVPVDPDPDRGTARGGTCSG